jgi:hypothetical protein
MIYLKSLIILLILLIFAYGVLFLMNILRKKHNWSFNKSLNSDITIKQYLAIDSETKLISIEDDTKKYLVIIGKGYAYNLNIQPK